jgi:2-methylisocitrate lyase-like PEP mutase family enzyme
MTLKQRLNEPRLMLAPGVYDALTALVAEQSGFEAVYLSGASIAYTRLGRSDVGLTTMSEVCDTVTSIRERIRIPLIVDADTGFGNALNMQRTIARLERAGANLIQIEDQTFPKRCGHLGGKTVVGTAEMVGKIKAALDARQDADTLIIARTDAVAVEGFAPALERAEHFLEAGADVLFIEAVRDEAQMGEVNARFAGRIPLLANMVEGGQTPIRSAQDLESIGYRIAIFPGGTARAVAHTLRNYYGSLKQHGTTAPYRDRMLDFDQLNALIGTPELLALGQRYDG